ncbi:MAG: AMP-binding protein, partial [Burkholderiaceae bacterium]
MPPDGAPLLDDPQLFIVEQFGIHARFMPDKEAVVCGDTRRTWAAFDANISKVANALIRDGFTRGCRVAVLMGNSV